METSFDFGKKIINSSTPKKHNSKKNSIFISRKTPTFQFMQKNYLNFHSLFRSFPSRYFSTLKLISRNEWQIVSFHKYCVQCCHIFFSSHTQHTRCSFFHFKNWQKVLLLLRLWFMNVKEIECMWNTRSKLDVMNDMCEEEANASIKHVLLLLII
jgi:CTP:phosphocholine cytidylyltransferase-like protein